MTLQKKKKKKNVYDWFLKYFTRPQSVPDSQLFKMSTRQQKLRDATKSVNATLSYVSRKQFFSRSRR